jgi:hypothetical protein
MDFGEALLSGGAVEGGGRDEGRSGEASLLMFDLWFSSEYKSGSLVERLAQGGGVGSKHRLMVELNGWADLGWNWVFWYWMSFCWSGCIVFWGRGFRMVWGLD